MELNTSVKKSFALISIVFSSSLILALIIAGFALIPKNPEENFQTIVYLLCCDKLLPSECNSLNFTYISVKTGDVRSIKFTEAIKKKYEEKVTRILEGIKRLHEPAIKRTELCKLCPYSKICV